MKTMKLYLLGLLFSCNALAIIPENGWWWNPAESGRGFNLEVQDNLLFFASFAYDASGNPAWYTAGGPMTSDRDWTAQLVVTSHGQCFGCAYVDPVRTVVGTATLHFTSPQKAVLTVNGTSIAVQRFDFWQNNAIPDGMAGEWSAVIGASSDVYDGERIDYTQKRTEASGTYMSGFRQGSDAGSNLAIVLYNQGQGQWVALLDSSSTFYRLFVFTTAGFDRVEGNFWVYPKGGNPAGGGTFYQAFRTASATFLATSAGPASTKRAATDVAQAFEERDARVFAAISSRAQAKESIPADVLEAARELEARLEQLKRER
jgi:hypothetical protein